MDNLAECIRVALDWDIMITKNGNTQETERYYIKVIYDVLEKNGYTVTSQASSQRSIDIETSMGNFECKKKNKRNSPFILNDTLPKQDVYYIFMITEDRSVIIKKGEELIRFKVTDGSNKSSALKICSTIMNYVDDKSTIHNVIDAFFEFINISVFYGNLSLYDFGQMFKRTIIFDNLKSRPRPNWSIFL
jgi:hypothetical protein